MPQPSYISWLKAVLIAITATYLPLLLLAIVIGFLESNTKWTNVRVTDAMWPLFPIAPGLIFFEPVRRVIGISPQNIIFLFSGFAFTFFWILWLTCFARWAKVKWWWVFLITLATFSFFGFALF